MTASPETVLHFPPAEAPGADSVPAIAAEVASSLANTGNAARGSWSFSLDNIRANIAYMAPEARELLVWAFTWSIDPAHPIHFLEFCDRVDYSKNVVWKIYSGKYKHPTKDALMPAPEKLLKAIRDLRRLEAARQRLGRVGFVETATVKRVYQACDLARKSQTPVFIYGASQIGKTEALRQYCIDNNHGRSVLIELEATPGIRSLLQAIAVKVGVSPNANTPDLIDRIKRAVTRDMVIVLDEVHLLANVYRKGAFFACMETIRRIFVDHCKCGLVLTFTLLGFNETEKARARELEQIFRRGVHRINLGDRPSVADVKEIAGAWGLELPGKADEVTVPVGAGSLVEKPFERLGQLAKEDGLKAITGRLRAAFELAADKSAELTWEHFVLADALIKKNAATPAHGWAA